MHIPSQTAVGRTLAVGSSVPFDVLITPHQSLSDCACRILLASIAAGALLVQWPLLHFGLWPAGLFVGFDAMFLIVAVAACRADRRRAERVTVDDGRITVIRLGPRGQTQGTLTFATFGLSIERHVDPDYGNQRLVLCDRSRRVEIARDLDPNDRATFAAALLDALGRVGAPPRVLTYRSAPLAARASA